MLEHKAHCTNKSAIHSDLGLGPRFVLHFPLTPMAQGFPLPQVGEGSIKLFSKVPCRRPHGGSSPVVRGLSAPCELLTRMVGEVTGEARRLWNWSL